MGFWQNVFQSFSGASRLWFAPRVYHLGWSDSALTELFDSMSAAKLWRLQPHLRTVISFRARNVAQLSLHCFRRQPDGGRVRDRDSVLARTLAYVDGQMTAYELVYALVGDHDLYDRAWWVVAESVDSPSGWAIRRIPPTWVEPVWSNPFTLEKIRMTIDSRTVEAPAERVVRFPGFDPGSASGCSPTVEALKGTLREQVEAAKYREQIWKRGGRVSAVIERPADAAEWSAEAREAFRQDWYAKYTGNGPLAGGTPILEDGMKLSRIDFTAQEQQFVEAARLSLETVAAAFHVPAAMVGMGSEATFANMRAFRKMLYTETLGPLLRQIETRINAFLVPMLGLDDTHYVEFNVEEKLRGDFEEQASVLSTATGRPWMTANEARARQNLPALPSGDELVVPLNVLLGGQASPRDTGTQNEVPNPVQEQQPKALPAIKARPTKPEVDKYAEVLVEFLRRQGKTVASRIGAGRDWWDKDRWDEELTDALLAQAAYTSVEAAKRALRARGLDPAGYSVERTLAFLREASSRSAERINDTTRQQVESVVDSADDGETPDVSGVFDGDAAGSRAAAAAFTLAGFAAGFGTVESGRQTGAATKTWVTGPNPRP